VAGGVALGTAAAAAAAAAAAVRPSDADAGRALLLAQAELLYERYMRQQHRQQIRRLYQDHVATLAAEADRQRLVRHMRAGRLGLCLS
jgi:ribulose kinase